MSILCFGSLNIDHVYQVDHIARPGETLASTGYTLFAGGKGANQSAALARAGAAVFHAGAVGPDGSWLVEKLVADGVDMGYTASGDEPTGHAIIQVDRSGENAIVIHSGANSRISAQHVDDVLSKFMTEYILLLQNEINRIPEIVRKASERGMTICFNPAPFHPDVVEYPNEKVDLFILNRTEAMSLACCSDPRKEPPDPGALIEEVCQRFPKAEVIITLGAAGALYSGFGETLRLQAPKVEAVDTTGAGDTFIGYYLASRSAGDSHLTALERATAAAALCVTRPGAMDSIPYRAEVDAFAAPGNLEQTR